MRRTRWRSARETGSGRPVGHPGRERRLPVSDEALFAGHGPVSEVMASHDWSASAVGPPAGWSPLLRQFVQLMLASRFSMWMGWGPELAFFYNDAYRRDTLQSKHPWALGRPAREVWSEIWDDIGPRIVSVLETGRATWDESLLLFLDRAGYHEETYHTFSYSPLRNAGGHIAGFLCVVSEDTQRVLSERRLRALGELGDISAVTAPTAEQACAAALDVLSHHRLDIPFASIHLLDGSGSAAVRAGFYGTVDGPAGDLGRLLAVDDPRSPIRVALAAGEPVLLDGLDERHPGLLEPMPAPMQDWSPATVLAVPLPGTGGTGPVGVLLAGISPFRALDADYRQFLEIVGRQIASAVGDARAYQAQLRRAEELAELDRAKSEFFAGVSHELRTPLTLIAGPAEDGLADLDAPLPPAQRTRMEVIARNGGRLRRLVDTMLEFARLEAGRAVPHRTTVDLAALTRGIAESFSPAILRAGLRYLIDCPRLAAAVSVDVDMWEKIVLNLLSNAVKYTLDGQVRISLRPAVGGGIALVVSDTGIGIPEDELPRLFERFHRVRGATGRSQEGSGIGLALVDELAALHDGTATVDSTLGRGSAFTVTLPSSAWSSAEPISQPKPAAVGPYRDEAMQWVSPGAGALDLDDAATERDDVVPAGAGGGARVLVAEDNPDLRGFLARLLARHYAVTAVPDGAAALRAARLQPPDLVLTDVMMPGLDGFGLIEALRADPATATIPVIMLSARAGEEAAIEGLNAGADDYLVKPFSSHDLLARVRSNLAMARLRNHEGAWRTALINALQDGLYVVDPHGAVIEINQSFTDILGYTHEQLPCPAPHPWWPDPADDAVGYAAVLDAGRVVQDHGGGRFLLRLRHRDGHRLWASCSASTITEHDGTGAMVVGMVRDVTAEQRAAIRDRLLADTAVVLAGSGDLVDRLSAFARLAAPEFADLVVVSLLQPDGRLRPTAAAHRADPEVAARALRLAPHHIPASLAARYRQGRAFGLDTVPDLVVEAAGDEIDLAARRAVGVNSVLVVPLTVGGRLLGSLAFAATDRAHLDGGPDAPAAEGGGPPGRGGRRGRPAGRPRAPAPDRGGRSGVGRHRRRGRRHPRHHPGRGVRGRRG